jgi:hypothetical protein
MRRSRHLLPALVVTLIAIIAGAAVARADSTTTLLGYQIDLVSFKDNGNNTSTWTYAVTSDGDESKALSHWTLGIGACYRPITTPANGSPYTTPTDSSLGCGSSYSCKQTQCTVVHGTDATTGINGIKYEDCSPQLDANNRGTHIFQFTVSGVPNQPSEVQVGVKPGNVTANGQILGPACSPTAVSLRELSAQPVSPTNGMGRFFAQLAMTLGALGMRIAALVTRS